MLTNPNNIDRLGYYLVGKNKFYNKTSALMKSYRTRQQPVWVFNNDVYSSIDWTVPIEEGLASIYCRRAQQLRDQYDYLVLYFSGGADSINILHSFIDNDIFLDEIVFQYPKEVERVFNNNDLSNANFYSEIKYSALPILNSLRNKINPKTQIRHQDFSKPLLDLLKSDDWFEKTPMGSNITISGIARQASQDMESHILDLCDSSKRVAQILGIDKPLVYFDGTDYFAYFIDLSATHCPPVKRDANQELYNTFYQTEFFYWTPNMPEIVVKQAQEIKRHCEIDPAKKMLWANSRTMHISAYRDVMHPIIYPSSSNPLFQTNKPSSKVIREQDDWFWKTADQSLINNYMTVISYLKQNTDNYHSIDNDIMNGLKGNISQYYKL